MRQPDFYRYFLGCRPGPDLRCLLAGLGEAARQEVRIDLLHLTLCVIAEGRERDHFLLPRVQAALAGQPLGSFQIRLGRVRGNCHGAMVGEIGRQDQIQDFYRALIRMLGTRDIVPLHRKSGLKAHITLGYEACDMEPFRFPFEWFPDQLLLIESEVGATKHNVLGSWPLLPPPQGSFPFGLPAISAEDWRRAG